MKTVLTVIGAAFALTVLLLCIPVKLRFSHKNGEAALTVRYLFLKKDILPAKPSPASESDESGQKRPRRGSDKKTSDKKKKLGSVDKKELALTAIKMLPKCVLPVRRFLRRTTVAHLDLCMVISGEDAADTAIKFGRANAAVFPGIKLLSEIVTLSYDRLEIVPDFTDGDGKSEVSGEVRLIPMAALIAGVNIVIIASGAFIKAGKKPIERKPQHGKEQPANK